MAVMCFMNKTTPEAGKGVAAAVAAAVVVVTFHLPHKGVIRETPTNLGIKGCKWLFSFLVSFKI